jgi:hypothetical protein
VDCRWFLSAFGSTPSVGFLDRVIASSHLRHAVGSFLSIILSIVVATNPSEMSSSSKIPGQMRGSAARIRFLHVRKFSDQLVTHGQPGSAVGYFQRRRSRCPGRGVAAGQDIFILSRSTARRLRGNSKAITREQEGLRLRRGCDPIQVLGRLRPCHRTD